MAEKSHIEWTDATWNPITGCSVVKRGCKNCYAMKLAGGRLKNIPSRKGLTQPSKNGPVWTGEVRFNEQWLDQPLRWKKPRRIFVCAHGDLFHENVPDEWIDQVFAVMSSCPQHTFQILTKRPRRMYKYMMSQGREFLIGHEMGKIYYERFDGNRVPKSLEEARKNPDQLGWPLSNVWLGVSVEDQETANERIPYLLDTPAAVRWTSAEPLLDELDLENLDLNAFMAADAVPRAYTDYHRIHLDALRGNIKPVDHESLSGLDWVVVGGESGPGWRPFNPDWARKLRDQCASAGVAFFMKQMGGKADIPEDLQVRDWPFAAQYWGDYSDEVTEEHIKAIREATGNVHPDDPRVTYISKGW